jgi:hypothetical protein
MPVKSKGTLSLFGNGFIPGRKHSLKSIWQWFKPLDFHRVFYKMNNLEALCWRASRLATEILIAESNVLGWLTLNSRVTNDKCAAGLKFN